MCRRGYKINPANNPGRVDSKAPVCYAGKREVFRMPKINVSLPAEVISAMDENAARYGMSRSEYIRRAVELYARYRSLERMMEEHRRIISDAVRTQDELAERQAEYVA